MEETQRRIPIKTSLGTFQFEFSAKGLYAVRFPRNGQRSTGNVTASRFFVDRRALCVAPKQNIQAVLLKKITNGKLDLTGYTPFQRRVYATLTKVPAGRTVTYGELAKRAGYPGAARAAGSAMKKNRLPVVIPCHRVVPVAGGIGEYSAGKKWKRILLDSERVGL